MIFALPVKAGLALSCLRLHLSHEYPSPPLCRILYNPVFFLFLWLRQGHPLISYLFSRTILGASSYCYPEKEDPLDGCRLAALYGLPNGAHWDQVPELKLFDRTFSASNLSRKQARAARMIVFSWGEAWCQVCTSQKQAYHGSVTTDVLQWFFFGFLDKCKACLDLPLGPLQPWFLVSHRILSWPPSPNKSSVRSSRVLDDTHVRWSWPQLFLTELN